MVFTHAADVLPKAADAWPVIVPDQIRTDKRTG
jgi:hypothetical protein